MKIPIIKVVDKIIFGENVTGVTIYPFIFIKKGYDTPSTLNHESIHIKQQIELLIIPFYILYFLFYLINLFRKGDAYFKIPFEKESYSNENNMEYLKGRKFWSWIKYI